MSRGDGRRIPPSTRARAAIALAKGLPKAATARKLGFAKEVVLPEFVKDQVGRRQDLILMRCNLDRLWQEYEAELANSDWQRTR